MVIKKKYIVAIILSLCINFMVVTHSESLYTDSTTINVNSTLRIEGISAENIAELSAKEIDSMPMRAILDNVIILPNNTNEKVKCKSINLSYLLNDFCGINVKDADVLFIDSKNKHSIIISLSDLEDKKNGYSLIYQFTNKDSMNKSGFILLNNSGLLSTKTANILYVDNIKIHTELNVKELPKTAPEFKDLDGEYEYAKNAISELAKMDMITGISETEFSPEYELTRAELAKIIVDTLKLNKLSYDNRYSDVSSTDYYAPYIASVVNEGIMYGYTDGTFGYNSQINRQEFATICTEIAIKTGKVTEDDILEYSLKNSRFKDRASVFGWIENSVAYLDSIGAYNIYIKDEFSPLRSINKAEASFVIYTLLFDN